MRILLDGLMILSQYKVGIVIFFVSAIGLGLWVTRLYSIEAEYWAMLRLSLALPLGILVLVPLSFILVLLDRVWLPLLAAGGWLVALLGIIALIYSLIRKEVSILSLLIFGFAIVSLLIVRLAFLKEIILPPYDDSPEHFSIVQDFLSASSGGNSFYSIETTAIHYYHFGFHVLAAWLGSVSRIDAANVIALLGQLFLVIAPISVFILATLLTKDARAGLIAAVFAAFAWRMPAFAANWGKYPAITGLALFPAVIGLWILFLQSPTKRRASRVFLILITPSLIFIHTRLVICLLLAGISYFAAQRLPLNRILRIWEACVCALIVIAIFLLFGDSLYAFYANGFLIPLVVTALLLPFAFRYFPRAAFGISLFVLGSWIASRLPTFSQSLGPAWLDGPFVETLLYIPLSLLAGIGFLGLVDQLPGRSLKRVAVAAIAVVIAAGALSSNVIYPDRCCNYVKESDIQALHWIGENTPQDAVVWIAAFKSRNYLVGMDAGVWTYALTGRNTNKLHYDFNWDSPEAISRICQPGYKSVYIYVGAMPYSFDAARIEEQLWLQRVFAAGETKIYRVRDSCVDQKSH